ncbi:hypothetical protein F971_00858 [Acinetobacter vivianii]|uniref:Tail specific protease domain-containing protein n=2 Tax=Acinetobacter vivianii TaxID=1776742 RepID=N8V1Y0_9GAMM|nr:hypothetical protein F971_00858 [Acinetobacter vivianii]
MFKCYSFIVKIFLVIFTSSFMLIQTAYTANNLEPMTSVECFHDINFASDFLLENDAGIKVKNWINYPEYIQLFLDISKKETIKVKTIQDCINITKPFLKAIRKGHIGLQNESIANSFEKNEIFQSDNFVVTKKLSSLTSYILIPSFVPSIEDQLGEIIKNNQDNILNAKYLILDLRKNIGGQDDSAKVLFKLLGEEEYWTEMPQIYTSNANIQAYKNIERIIPNIKTKEYLAEIIKKMESKKNGWVYIDGDASLIVEKINKRDVLANPKKVVVLTDESTASSGEEFIKSVKQNPRVVTMGRNTYGALDASNLREVQTPSKKLYLLYATTYVHRRPGQEIDNIGIPPNIQLPKPVDQPTYENEVKIAQNYLEKENY